MPAPDKYRGAVVEVRTLTTSNVHSHIVAIRISNFPPRFRSQPTNPSSAQLSLHTSAISLTYRDYAHDSLHTLMD